MNTNTARQLDQNAVYEMNNVIRMRDNSPEKLRLDQLRKLSNIVQALENLVTQCEICDGFEDLVTFANFHLTRVNSILRADLHF